MRDRATIIAAGVTVHETLKAAEQLEREGLAVRVVDAYSIKPIDAATIRHAAEETGALLIVEDHYPQGGTRRRCTGGRSWPSAEIS